MNPEGGRHGPAAPPPDDRPADAPVEEDDPRVVAALEEYLAALEAGRRPDRRRFLARYAEIAGPLSSCLDGLELVRSAASRLNRSRPAPATSTGDAFRPSTRLGDYLIHREIGRGGMGVVYEAEQVSLGRRVALKILPQAAALDAKQRLRFQTEAHAAACLSHRHIVPVYSVGCEDGVHYYAMQFIPGRSLAELIAQLRRGDPTVTPKAGAEAEGDPPAEDRPAAIAFPSTVTAGDSPPTPPEGGRPTAPAPASATATSLPSTGGRDFSRSVARLGIQAAEALEHAHQQGIVHRDVKPSNLLLDPQGDLWVADFGLARIQDDVGVTLTGDLVGTLRYMSPEQALAKRAAIDHRTDVYSLGATLYELLTLEPVFDGRDRQELLRQIAFDEPRPPRRVRPGIPRELETIVLKAMAKDPCGRYASARELADDLRRFLDGQPILARRRSPIDHAAKWAMRHRSTVAAVAVVLAMAVVGMGVATVLLWREKARTEDNLTLAYRALDQFCSLVGEKGEDLDPVREQGIQDVLGTTLELYERLALQTPTGPEARWSKARAYHRLGSIGERLKQHDKAEDAFRQAHLLLETLLADSPQNAEYREEASHVLLHLGAVVHRESVEHLPRRFPEAERYFRRAIEIDRGLADEFPSVAKYRFNLAQSYCQLNTALDGQGRRLDQERALRDARAILEKLSSGLELQLPSRVALAVVDTDLGNMMRLSGRPREAEETFDRAVANLKRLSPAEPTYREQIAKAYTYLCCPLICNPIKEPEKARRHYRRALDAWLKLAADFPKRSLYYKERWAEMQRAWVAFLAGTGQVDEALGAQRELVAVLEGLATSAPEEAGYRRQWAQALSMLGLMLLEARHPSEAWPAFDRAARLSPTLADVQDNNVAWVLATCADPLVRDPGRAVELARKAVASKPKAGDFWNTLGAALARAGAWDEACSAFTTSMQLRGGGDSRDWFFLALAHWHRGDREGARRWYDRAEAWMRKKLPQDPELVRFRAEAANVLGLPAPESPPDPDQLPTAAALTPMAVDTSALDRIGP
jgi:serine/threonine protein kinase/tetratricopeptide (TPR) repeat protein